MAWLIWLLVPVAATVVVAGLSWFRSRPVRRPDGEAAMRRHAEYLDALVQTPRSLDRGPYRAGSTDQVS